MSTGSTQKQYPGAIDTFATWQDDVDVIVAPIVNDVQDQVIVVETTLGTNPQGSQSSVKNRLAVSLNNDGTVKNAVIGESQLNIGSGTNQVDHYTLGFQKKTITVSATNGEYTFVFVSEGLVDYVDGSYQVILTPVGTNGGLVWAVVKSTLATTGFTIALRQGGTNGWAPYNASTNNVAVSVLTLHQV
jgi:hypothetical protein